MPISAPRPCTHTGCPNLSTIGLCADHKHDKWERHQKGRTSTQRGYGATWRKVRNKVMTRDKGLCQVCLAKGIYSKAKEVDHIKGKEQGGTDHPSNLQSICIQCHRSKTSLEGKHYE